MKLKVNERALLTMSSGLLAGLGTSINLMAVPAILASDDPLPAWCTLYDKGKKIAVTAISVTAVAGIGCFFKKDDWRYLLVAGLAATIPPYTLLVMMPTNEALKAIAHEDREARATGNKGSLRADSISKIRALIKKWDQMQYGRTFLGLSAFLVNLTIVHKMF